MVTLLPYDACASRRAHGTDFSHMIVIMIVIEYDDDEAAAAPFGVPSARPSSLSQPTRRRARRASRSSTPELSLSLVWLRSGCVVPTRARLMCIHVPVRVASCHPALLLELVRTRTYTPSPVVSPSPPLALAADWGLRRSQRALLEVSSGLSAVCARVFSRSMGTRCSAHC